MLVAQPVHGPAKRRWIVLKGIWTMKLNGDKIKAVFFDFDGTLTLPGALDFPLIRQTLGCPADQPILEFIQQIEDVAGRQAARDRLALFEIEAARRSQPNPGAHDIIAWIKRRQLAIGIITRNSRASVLQALQNFHPLGPADFDILVTRDDPVSPKPSGAGLLWGARRLHVRPQETLMVGDFIYDCQAGQSRRRQDRAARSPKRSAPAGGRLRFSHPPFDGADPDSCVLKEITVPTSI